MSRYSEDHLELATLDWFKALGYSIAHGPEIAPDGTSPERATYADVILVERLRASLSQINKHLPEEAIDEAVRLIVRAETPSLVENNQRFHALLTDGVSVSYRRKDGTLKGDRVRLFDFETLGNNDWLAVNQLGLLNNRSNQREDRV